MTQFSMNALRGSIAMMTCLALSAPAHALVGAPGNAATSASASTATNRAGTPAPAAKQHCMMLEALTGTRMKKRTCKTIAEWEALGYTVKTER